MTSAAQALPRWDMDVIFPGPNSAEFEAAMRAWLDKIDALSRLFDEQGIGKEASGLDVATVSAFDEIIARYNEVVSETRTLLSYVSCLVAADAGDDVAQARQSELQQHNVRLVQLGTRLTAWIGTLDVEALLARSGVARDHAFFLQRAKVRATHLMSPAEESLAAELGPVAGGAWGKLHGNLTAELIVPVEVKGEARKLPMSVVRTFAFDPDRDVRRAAYEAELAGWERAALPLAAAMNSIKGQVGILSRRRGWDTPLDEALFDNNIDRATLDAMMSAAREAFPDFRRYLKAKARALGIPVLAWYDIFAPVGRNGGKEWSFDTGAQFIVQQFGTYSDKMSGFATRAFSENWIDAEPRAGKRDGAFCSGIRGDESRIFSNYQEAFNGVSTLAHELGHAYHNLNLSERTMLQRNTPMALAETASIFCETIIREAGLRGADANEQLVILEASLQGSCQVVVDITSRFQFEQQVFEDRRQRELSVDELKALMLQAQRDTYGDGLDADLLHPYMWAMKPHYYSSGRSFYNFPYMFGLLFGLGLYARYQAEPEAFKAGYDDLLSSTGLADAATLAGRFGIEIRTPDFWRSSFAIIRDDIDRFEALVG